MFLNGMPFASMVGGVIFLNETIGWIHIMALIFTSLGIVIGTVKQRGSILSSNKGNPVKS